MTFRKLCLLLLVCCIFLTGCFDSSVILERLSISVAMGFDKKNDEEMVVTTVLLAALPEATEASQVLSVTADTSKGAKDKFDREVSRKLVGGQVRSIIYDRGLAKEGIMNIADTLSRDPAFGDMVYLMVSNESSEDLLHYKYTHFPNVGLYLGEMIDQNIELGWLMPSTIHYFRKRFYSVGIDPALPIIERKGSLLNVKGSAVFRDDRMVGEISAKESSYLTLVSNKIKPSSLQIVMKKDGLSKYIKHDTQRTPTVKVDLRNLNFSTSVKLVSAKDLQFEVNVKMDSELQEISADYHFSIPGAIDLLEREMKSHLEQELLAFFEHLQQLGSDPVGFGEIYRSSVRHSGITKEQWRDMFPKAAFKTNVNIRLVRTGTIE